MKKFTFLLLILIVPIFGFSKVIHTVLNPQVEIDPVNDFAEFFLNDDSTLSISFYHEYNGLGLNQFVTGSGFITTGDLDLYPLQENDIVDTSRNAMFAAYIYSDLDWLGETNGHLKGRTFYMGFTRYEKGSEDIHCGWVKASLNSSGSRLTILEFAYCDVPFLPVIVGSTKDVIQAESLSIESETGKFEITSNGTRLKLIANLSPTDVTLKTVSWRITSGAEYAYISSGSGVVSPLGNGTVEIEAATNDGSGLTDKVTITISGQVNSINDHMVNNLRIISKDGNIVLETDNNSQVEFVIFDLKGTIISKGHFNGQKLIPMSSIGVKGTFIVRLNDENQNLSKKFDFRY